MAGKVLHSFETVQYTEDDKRFLTGLLSLQELDTDLYMTPQSWKTSSARGTYGGQTVSQALIAASKTVSAGLNLHSMHSYFLRAGDAKKPTIFRVQRTRDGQSFSSRTVSAIQNGKPILTLQASFHNEDAEAASVLSYQTTMPVVKHHRDLLTIEECINELLSGETVSTRYKSKLQESMKIEFPIEIKPVEPDVYMRISPNPNHTLCAWVKASGNLGDEQNVHRCAAAFISDWSLLWSSLTSNITVRISMMASLDHSIWFHKEIKMDQWLLYEAVSNQMHNGRAFCHGRLWTEDGQLVASIAQEGILRGRM